MHLQLVLTVLATLLNVTNKVRVRVRARVRVRLPLTLN